MSAFKKPLRITLEKIIFVGLIHMLQDYTTLSELILFCNLEKTFGKIHLSKCEFNMIKEVIRMALKIRKKLQFYSLFLGYHNMATTVFVDTFLI